MEQNRGFIYSLIANSKKVVLAEYLELKGNFPQIVRVLLEKIEKKGKVIINYDDYKIQYLFENNLIFILFSINVEDNIAFAYLNDLKTEITGKYSIEELNNMNSLQFEEGKKILENRFLYYKYGAVITMKGQMIKNLNLARDAVIDNLENLIERDKKMDIIIHKSDNLLEFSNNLSSIGEAFNKNEENKRKNKYLCFFIFIIIIIILIIIYKN